MADSILEQAATLLSDAFATSSYFALVDENPLYAVPVGQMPALFWWLGGEFVEDGGGAGETQYLKTKLFCSLVVEAESGSELGSEVRAARAEVMGLLNGAVTSSGALGTVISMVSYVGADEPAPLQESGQPIIEQTLEFQLEREEKHLNAFAKG